MGKGVWGSPPFGPSYSLVRFRLRTRNNRKEDRKRTTEEALRFRSVLALTACGVLMMGAEDPGCNKDRAQGQKPAPVPNEPVPNADPYPQRDDRQIRVTFKMNTRPMNTQRITWKLGSKGNTFQWHDDSWDRTEVGAPGDVATLTVQADEQGRFVICQIWVNGQMPTVPMLSPGDNPYMHRNDAGDCKVRVTLK